jgi:ABC-2 type transport system ATP-binding protein
MPEHAQQVKGKIGLVPDETLLFDHLTGLEFTEFVGRMYGLERPVARERSRELLALFELDGEPGKLIGDYSKGMRKRVAMAAALIHRPELFLLDEPFEGVDAVGARLMKEILLDQVRRGATMFLTSHVLEVVERLCDRVAIIHDGRLAENSNHCATKQEPNLPVKPTSEKGVQACGRSGQYDVKQITHQRISRLLLRQAILTGL